MEKKTPSIPVGTKVVAVRESDCQDGTFLKLVLDSQLCVGYNLVLACCVSRIYQFSCFVGFFSRFMKGRGLAFCLASSRAYLRLSNQ